MLNRERTVLQIRNMNVSANSFPEASFKSRINSHRRRTRTCANPVTSLVRAGLNNHEWQPSPISKTDS
jgi:hypothetical protein